MLEFPIHLVKQMIIDKCENHLQCLNEDLLLLILDNQKMITYLK